LDAFGSAFASSAFCLKAAAFFKHSATLSADMLPAQLNTPKDSQNGYVKRQAVHLDDHLQLSLRAI
jgi:hypothetical protein